MQLNFELEQSVHYNVCPQISGYKSSFENLSVSVNIIFKV